MKKKPFKNLKQRATRKWTFTKMDLQEKISRWPEKHLETAFLFTLITTLLVIFDATNTFMNIAELVLPAGMWFALIESTLSKKPSLKRFCLYDAALLVLAFGILMLCMYVGEFDGENDPALRVLANGAAMSIGGAFIMVCFWLVQEASARINKIGGPKKK